jgi:hypothetical protein
VSAMVVQVVGVVMQLIFARQARPKASEALSQKGVAVPVIAATRWGKLSPERRATVDGTRYARCMVSLEGASR